MFLTVNDFFIKNGELCNKISGYSFIFFTSNDCRYCNDVKPHFDKLSQAIQGCSFAYMDVAQNYQQIVQMSERTNNRIEYVPLLILYINGNRMAQYFPDEENPQNNYQNMINFIFYHTNKNKDPTDTSSTQHPSAGRAERDTQSDIPAYTIGIPGNLASKRVCYLSFDSAYNKINKK
ncbi:MAG: thioredoxin family protein [Cetobacterium sp.]